MGNLRYLPKYSMTQDELTDLIEQGLSQAEIAHRVGKSKTTVRHYLAKYGMSTRRQKCNKGPADLVCKSCGETEASKFYQHKDGRRRFRCKRCDAAAITQLFRDRKQEAIDYKGGRCERCGYNNCQAALEFHHRNPEEKDMRWEQMRGWAVNRIRAELDKCDLLCANCHAEVHYMGH